MVRMGSQLIGLMAALFAGHLQFAGASVRERGERVKTGLPCLPMKYQGLLNAGDKESNQMVRTAGIEPARPYRREILSLLRLPVSPRPLGKRLLYAPACRGMQSCRGARPFRTPPLPHVWNRGRATARRDAQPRAAADRAWRCSAGARGNACQPTVRRKRCHDTRAGPWCGR